MIEELLKDTYSRLGAGLRELESDFSSNAPSDAPTVEQNTEILSALDLLLLPLAKADDSPLNWRDEIRLHGTALNCLKAITGDNETIAGNEEDECAIYKKIQEYASRLAGLAHKVWEKSKNIDDLRFEKYCRIIAATYLERELMLPSNAKVTNEQKKSIFKEFHILADTLEELVINDPEARDNSFQLKTWSGVAGKYAREIAEAGSSLPEKIRYFQLCYTENFRSAAAASELAEFETDQRERIFLLEYALQWYYVAADVIDKCLERTNDDACESRIGFLRMAAKARYAAASIRIDGEYLELMWQAKHYVRLLADQTRLALYKGAENSVEMKKAESTIEEIRKILHADAAHKIDKYTRTLCDKRIEHAQIIIGYLRGERDSVAESLKQIGMEASNELPYLIKHAMKDNPEFAAFFGSACEKESSLEKTANAEISSAAETDTKTEASNAAII